MFGDLRAAAEVPRGLNFFLKTFRVYVHIKFLISANDRIEGDRERQTLRGPDSVDESNAQLECRFPIVPMVGKIDAEPPERRGIIDILNANRPNWISYVFIRSQQFLLPHSFLITEDG